MHKELGTPLTFAAPEVFFRDALTPACDVWALGCLLFEILTTFPLWGCLLHQYEVIEQWINAFGPLPERWWAKRHNSLDTFLASGKPRERPPLCTMIARDLDRGQRWTEDERAELTKLIIDMVKLEPHERLSIRDAMHCLPAAWPRGEEIEGSCKNGTLGVPDKCPSSSNAGTVGC